jgi:hypothetical protein
MKTAHELRGFLMILTSRKNKHPRQFVERKLIIRLRIFFIVFILMLIAIIYEMINEYIPKPKQQAFFQLVY